MSTITVASTAALTSALAQAHAGDTIRLQAGQYDGLAIKNLSFTQDVTITSADPLHQATLSNFDMTHVTGLTISNVQLLAKGPVGYYDFNVRDSSDVHFDHVSVHGSLDGDASNDAKGIAFSNSSNVSITNSEFQQLGVGAAVTNSSKIQITGNTVHDMRSDGFDFAQVDHIAISGNNFTSFHPLASDHADAIQFWTTGTTAASHDIAISNNVITVGSGTGSQGIFMRDTDGSLAFQNVSITGNMVVGSNDPNAIRVIYANGVTVSDNVVTSNAGIYQSRLEIDNASHVVSSNNQAVVIAMSNDTQLSETGDRLNNVMSDNGNSVLATWLHAQGEDALYANLKSAVSQLAMSVLGGPNLATVATAAEQTLVGIQQMDPTASSLKLAGAADFAVIANDLNDSITGNSGANQIYGMGGNDTINGGGGDDTLTGGTGDDVYITNRLATVVEQAGGGNDTVIATGNYTLGANVENLVIDPTTTNNATGTGNELNNQVTGNSGANILDGAAGDDTINGGAGADTIIGGAGDDRLTGGAGADTFRFAPHSGHDVITDFGAGSDIDKIDISAYKSAGLNPTLHDVGANVVISFTTGDTITLLGVHAHDLTATTTGWIF